MTALDILFQDQFLVAVHKPSGILVHRTALSRDRVCVLQKLRDQIGQRVYPVHRLDRSASGVLLFALDRGACQELSRQFARHQVTKTYLAVVRGYTPASDRIDHPLAKEADRPPRPAVTEYQTLDSVELPFAVGRYDTARYSLVAATARTGRRHQIRRHFAHISHPLVGDTVYGHGVHNRFFRSHFGLHRLMLAAVNLQIQHPATNRDLTIAAEPAPEFCQLMRSVGWHVHSSQNPGGPSHRQTDRPLKGCDTEGDDPVKRAIACP